MIPFVFAFLLGDLCLQNLAHLPGNFHIFLTMGFATLFAYLLKNRWPIAPLILGLACGFSFTAWYAANILSFTLPKELEGRPLLIRGIITSIPVTTKWQTHFEFLIDNLQTEKKSTNPKIKIRLSWREKNPPIRVGDEWQFYVKLQRIHAPQNPGSYDFEAFALQKNLRARGYILPSEKNIRRAHYWYRYPINQFRQKLQEKILAHITPSAVTPWLLALIIGERHGIAQEDWQVLRNTGTNHLMAIAGLHIGIVAGLAHYLIAFLWRRSTFLLLILPASQAAAVASLMTALTYSALAGFSIPTERACLMLSFYILIVLLKRQVNAWHLFSFTLLIVLLNNPLSILSQSFCLSFATIALIIYGMSGRLPQKNLWWKWGRVQWVIGFGLIPFCLLLFAECSLISFIANSITIPWLGFLILPLLLLGTMSLFFSPTLAQWLFSIADYNLTVLWQFLTWLAHFNFSSFSLAMPNTAIFLATVIAFLLFLLPYGFPGRWLGCIWLLPLICYSPTRPLPQEFWLTILDVGQGLSVIVQTEHHTLVYDAGAKYNNADAGENIVLPYLKTLQVNLIDKLIISHGDNDHSGGAQALINALPIHEISTSVPEKFPHQPATLCLAKQSWQWDQVKFEFLYPTPNHLHLNNDSSCVLRISNGWQSVLLTGDIEKHAENYLLQSAPHALPATILIAPHHGSKTSALPDFVTAVNPHIVVYATGYRNRYHFPHPSVMKAYMAIQAQQWNTTETGTLKFKIKANPEKPSAEAYRIKEKRYWYD